MKKSIKLLSLMLGVCIFFTACSAGDDTRLKIPSDAKSYEGRHYEEVVEELKLVGFTNITTDKLEDLILGWLTKDGEIESISIDGTGKFKGDDAFNPDTEIKITYHAFPEKEQKPAKEAVEETPKQEVPEAPVAAVEPEPQTIEGNITAETNAEFASVLESTSTTNQSIIDFANKYRGEMIEFDAHVADIAPYKDYKTRYNILLYVGDYRTEGFTGPYFKLVNIGPSQLPKGGLYADENVRIIGSISGFNESTSIMELNLETITIR